MEEAVETVRDHQLKGLRSQFWGYIIYITQQLHCTIPNYLGFLLLNCRTTQQQHSATKINLGNDLIDYLPITWNRKKSRYHAIFQYLIDRSSFLL